MRADAEQEVVDENNQEAADEAKALKDEGATYTKALLPMTEKVVEDGRLLTGQNPMSAAGVAKAVVKLLKKQHRH